jgi:DNA-binding transcriptional MerR regulator
VTEYRVDDLAQAAGMTVRNVRAYQERGLLPVPLRRGRTSWYDDTHLARLRLIGRLLDRGYTSAHIAAFIADWESGHDIGSTLGLEAALLAPGSAELPEELGYDELVATMGGLTEAGALEEAVELGLLSRVGEDRFRIHRPRLLRAGAELVGIGMSVDQALELAVALRKRVRAVSSLFVTTVASHIVAQHPPGWVPSDAEIPELVAIVERLRPLARVAVDEELGPALDADLQDFFGDWLSRTVGRGTPTDGPSVGL